MFTGIIGTYPLLYPYCKSAVWNATGTLLNGVIAVLLGLYGWQEQKSG